MIVRDETCIYISIFFRDNACMQLVNHGIPNQVISNMFDVAKRFFKLPFEERSKYMSTDMGSAVRCGTSFNQNKDSVFCWRDFLKLSCQPYSDVLPLWPSSPSDLRWKYIYIYIVVINN